MADNETAAPAEQEEAGQNQEINEDLDGFLSDDPLEQKIEVPEESTEESKDSKSEEEEVEKSEVIQKKKYREKLREREKELEEARQELEKLKEKPSASEDEQREQEAKNYIKTLAKEAYKEQEKERKAEEARALEKFEAELEEVLDDNPDLTEKQIMDLTEELTISPTVAAKILKKVGQEFKNKPKIPKPKRGSSDLKSTEVKQAEADKSKSMFDLAREVKAELNK